MLKKKLTYRAVFLVVLLAMLLMLVCNMVSCITILRDYEADFLSTSDSIVRGNFTDEIRAIEGSNKREFIKQYELNELIKKYSASLGLNDDRHIYILSVPGGEIISPDGNTEAVFEKTKNLSNALDRKTVGMESDSMREFLDYACYIAPMDDSVSNGYAVYIIDNKASLLRTFRHNAIVFLWIFIGGIFLAAIIAIMLSRSVTVPLKKLSRRADNFAKGMYDLAPEMPRDDEIGSLVRAFNHMGSVMSRSISQISAEKHKADVIMEHIRNGIMAYDTNGNLIHINTAAKELFDIDKEAPIFDEFFKEMGAGICMAEFLYLDKYSTVIRDVTMGENRHIRIYFVPFKMDNDRTAGVVCVFEDYTEQFNLEIARREFVAEVSHELKTPLSIIKMHAETLLNGYLDDKTMSRKFLTTIETEADKMTALVRNLLDLSKFDVRKFEMKKQVFSIDEMLRGIVSRFSLEAEIDDIDLVYTPVNELPKMYADPEQIERALVNIVSNAIKYGEKGGHVSIAAGSMYNEVYIKIEDDGHGIPKSDLEHVFDRFFRVDRARTREKGGTGLGLSIAKEIIESHGGSIAIESEYGKYTKVTINLPTVKE